MKPASIHQLMSLLCGIILAGVIITGCAKPTTKTPVANAKPAASVKETAAIPPGANDQAPTTDPKPSAANAKPSAPQGTTAVNPTGRAGKTPSATGQPSSRQRSAPGDQSGMRGQMMTFFTEHKNTFDLLGFVGRISRLETEGKTPLTVTQAKDIMAVITPLKTQKELTQDQAKSALERIKKVLTSQQITAVEQVPQFGRGNGGASGPGAGGRGPGAGGQGFTGRGPGVNGQGAGGRAPGAGGQGDAGGQGYAGRGPGAGGPGAGGPGAGRRNPGTGGPGGGVGRPNFDPAAMKNYNPFNTSTAGGGMGRGGGLLTSAIAQIEKKAGATR